MVFKVAVEGPQGSHGGAEVGIAAVVVKAGGDHDHGLDLSIFDHVIQDVLDHAVSDKEILARAAAPAVHQVENIVARIAALLIAIGQIDIGGLLDLFAVSRIVPGLIGQRSHLAGVFCWLRVGLGNRHGHAGLRDALLHVCLRFCGRWLRGSLCDRLLRLCGCGRFVCSGRHGFLAGSLNYSLRRLPRNRFPGAGAESQGKEQNHCQNPIYASHGLTRPARA